MRHDHSQSSGAIDRIRKNLVYIRMRTARAEKTRQRVKVIIPTGCRFGGLIKLDVTPGGGGSAGPFNSALSAAILCSGVKIAVVEVAMLLILKLQVMGVS